MQGEWDYKSEYSYDMSLCERGLSLVVSYVKKRSAGVTSYEEAVALIDEGFRVHSTEGELRHKARNYFSFYERNHEEFLNDN